LIPNDKYKEQKSMNEVRTNATAKMPDVIASVPEIRFVNIADIAVTVIMMKLA
jgi:hypothetical protein